MRGNIARAVPLLVNAAKLAPANAEIRLHLAQAHAAAGDIPAAKREMSKALELAPSMRDLPEVKAIQAR